MPIDLTPGSAHPARAEALLRAALERAYDAGHADAQDPITMDSPRFREQRVDTEFAKYQRALASTAPPPEPPAIDEGYHGGEGDSDE